MKHEYYDSILMLELSSMDLSSRKVVNMIQSSMNLQESILNWRFESYMFQEAHLLSHCISHWDISIKVQEILSILQDFYDSFFCFELVESVNCFVLQK